MSDNLPKTYHPRTQQVLDRVAQEPIRLGIQETSDPEEMLFVELITNGGMGITPAYLTATGRGDPESSEDMRRYSTAAQEMRNRPQVKVLLQRKLREHATNRMQDAELTRQRIFSELMAVLDDPMEQASTKLKAIDRIGKLTHIRAFDPPVARKEDDVPKSSTDILDRIRKLVKKDIS